MNAMTYQQASYSGGLLMSLTAIDAGHKLAEYLRRSKMQQKELAAALGVEPSYISRMVKGHINWTMGKHFGQIASKLALADHEIKMLHPASVVEIVQSSNMTQASAAEDAGPEIPPALLEAAAMYAQIDARIMDPAVQLALARAGYFGGGPQTPQDWIRYFNDVRDWIGRASN